MDDTHSTIRFFVNGRKVVDDNVDPEWTLLYYLRNKLHLCGTKLGCAEGGCGACTVMLSKYSHHLEKVHGVAVTTVEGIGNVKKLHPVQERIAKAHGSQCGFCTPGIVMSMYTLLRTNSQPTMDDLEVAFQGNLCRCTGYRPIIEGFRTFTEGWERSNVMMNGVANGCPKNACCKESGGCSNEEEILFNPSKFSPYDPTQEPIFPPELQLSSELNHQFLKVSGKRVTWYRPTTLNQLLILKKSHPQARIIVGNTEVGVEVKFKNCVYPVLIHPTQVKELTQVSHSNEGIKFGSSVTLDEIDGILKNEIRKLPEHKTQFFAGVVEMLHWFAGKQIRNVAAIGGNIMTGSPISDLNPIFIAARCKLELISTEGSRTITMDQSFFTGYRRNITRPEEVLLSITIPYSHKDTYFRAIKQARRRDDDIAIVNAAFNVELNEKSMKVKNAVLAFGGMAPTTVEAKNTAKVLQGRSWEPSLIEDTCNALVGDLPLSPDAPGGMIAYRRSLTLSMFYKYFVDIYQKISCNDPKLRPLPESEISAAQKMKNIHPKSSQYFQVVANGQSVTDSVGRPIVHVSALKQATGEAVYCDDMPHFENELYLSLVVSTRAHAKIVSVDASQALALKGVHAFFSAKDLPPERNRAGPIIHDEEIFISSKVTSIGQVIGAIVADDQPTAQQASKLVKVCYEDLKPVIVTIEDAIRLNSYFKSFERHLSNGNIQEGFKKSDHVLSGEIHIGGQEHFYLETNCTIAVPKGEDEEIEVFSSTQNPTESQKLIAMALGVPFNRVICRTKRMGGGFGGKESRTLMSALPVAIAAHKLNRPVRCMLDRDEDMVVTGGRHPFHGKYKVGFTQEGKILACDIEIYNNAGFSADLSGSVLERSVFHFENSYKIPNVRCVARCCKTNLPSNTAFRGFGGPQGMVFAESMVSDISAFLNIDAAKVSELNLYKEGDKTHYNQKLEYCTLTRCWKECLQKSDYYKQKEDINSFNRQHRWRKRGISIVPTKFGIAFTAKFLNQAGALIMIYTDGSVLLTHGGTEMGQGLHTKMLQVASRALQIPESLIHISETSTDKVPNTSATAASSGSDLNGMAILNACEIILERLKPFKEANPKGKWIDWVNAAYMERVSLSATGFYRTPDIGYSFETNSGNPFNYFTYGVACSAVEIDCLTGDHQVLRTDIVMDLGESLNPAIDIGQVEGAFIQGYGLFTLEELMYSPNGLLYSRGPGAYKLPGFGDIPAEFNVSLLRGAPNPRAVYSSKAVGEPPLFLAASVFFGLKDAVSAARKDAGLIGPFRFDSPATAARIRMACQDKFTAKITVPDKKEVTPWNVVP